MTTIPLNHLALATLGAIHADLVAAITADNTPGVDGSIAREDMAATLGHVCEEIDSRSAYGYPVFRLLAGEAFPGPTPGVAPADGWYWRRSLMSVVGPFGSQGAAIAAWSEFLATAAS